MTGRPLIVFTRKAVVHQTNVRLSEKIVNLSWLSMLVKFITFQSVVKCQLGVADDESLTHFLEKNSKFKPTDSENSEYGHVIPPITTSNVQNALLRAVLQPGNGKKLNDIECMEFAFIAIVFETMDAILFCCNF